MSSWRIFSKFPDLSWSTCTPDTTSRSLVCNVTVYSVLCIHLLVEFQNWLHLLVYNTLVFCALPFALVTMVSVDGLSKNDAVVYSIGDSSNHCNSIFDFSFIKRSTCSNVWYIHCNSFNPFSFFSFNNQESIVPQGCFGAPPFWCHKKKIFSWLLYRANRNTWTSVNTYICQFSVKFLYLLPSLESDVPVWVFHSCW